MLMALAVGVLAASPPARGQEETPWPQTLERLRNGDHPLPLCSNDDGTPIRLHQEGRSCCTYRTDAWRLLNVSEAWQAWFDGEGPLPLTGIPQAVGLVSGMTAFGDLDGDRIPEAVVGAYYNGGGSATWLYLLAMNYRDGRPAQAGVWALGAQTHVERLAIRDGRIFATMIVHGDSDPSCCPSVRVRREFTLRDRTIPFDVSEVRCGRASYIMDRVAQRQRARRRFLAPSWTAPYTAAIAPADTERWLLTLERLRNGHYPLPMFIDDAETPIRLQEGRASIAFSGTHAEWTETVTLGDLAAFGYLYGELDAEAAVIVRHDSGGAGAFVYLLAMRYRDGAPVQAGRRLLGDRVQVERLAIHFGHLFVAMITHGPSDPMCCPTARTLRVFEMRREKGELVLVGY